MAQTKLEITITDEDDGCVDVSIRTLAPTSGTQLAQHLQDLGIAEVGNGDIEVREVTRTPVARQ